MPWLLLTVDEDSALDRAADTTLRRLGGAGVLRARASFRADAYRRFAAEMDLEFRVPTTPLTGLACRVLFGLAAARAPRSVLGLGTFVGYCVAWLFGPALQTAGVYGAERLVACEVDPERSREAAANFRRLRGGERIEPVVSDAAQYLAGVTWPIDLLFIDVDSEREGKASYAALLRQATRKLASGALVVAHDVTHPWFREDMVSYRALVADRGLFRSTATLDVDPGGLEVTLV